MAARFFKLLLFIIVGMCVLGCEQRLSTHAAQGQGKFMPPDGKTLLIVGQDIGAVRGYTAEVRPSPGGVTTYTDISEYSQEHLLYGLKSTVNYGAGDVNGQLMLDEHPHSVLVIGLHMVDYSGRNLQKLADGSHDVAIDELGEFIKAAERPVFVRIGYEFDGAWNHYEPEQYITAYRHIVTRWRENNVENVATVWQSATSVHGRYKDLPVERWYPGDTYVDWMGTSYFEGDHAIHDAFLEFARAHNKPVMIAEATPQGYDLEQLTFATPTGSGAETRPVTPEEIWEQWYAPFFDYIHRNNDVIRAVAYINVDWKNQPMWGPAGGNGYWGDSRVQVNDTIQAQWLAEVERPMWLHGAPDLFTTLAH